MTPQPSSTDAPTNDSSDRAAAVAAVADKAPDKITATEASAATEWFMSPSEEEVASAVIPVNIAAAGAKEKIVDFKVQVVDRDVIRAIRKSAEVKNADGIRETDEMEANLRIVVEGLIDPDLKDPAMLTVRGQKYMDPADALKARFAFKPGLIDQLAGKIVQVSGYDDSDVKEVKAAGN